MKIFVFLFFVFLFGVACNQGNSSPAQSPFVFLKQNSPLRIIHSADGRSWKLYYEKVLVRNYELKPDAIGSKMKDYVSDSAVRKRLFGKRTDTTKVSFFKYNNRTAYFIDHKEDNEGGLEDRLLIDDFDDLLGHILCTYSSADSLQKWCVVFLYQNAQMVPVDTFLLQALK